MSLILNLVKTNTTKALALSNLNNAVAYNLSS